LKDWPYGVSVGKCWKWHELQPVPVCRANAGTAPSCNGNAINPAVASAMERISERDMGSLRVRGYRNPTVAVVKTE
jgi:hypothetical protein